MDSAYEIRTGYSIVPRARQSDPHTSHEAAQQNLSAAAHHVAVLLALKLFGASTAAEITARLSADVGGISVGFDSVEVTRRLSDLHKAGKIKRREVGTYKGRAIYHTRKGPSGRAMAVWYLAA